MNQSSNNKPNQNHSGAATQAVAGVEASIAINWNQQSNVHWHSHAQCRRQTYLWQAWLVSARLVLRKDGSNCPAKYTSWPCLAPSCSSAATLIAAWQQWHHHSIPAALPEHLCSIAEAPRNAKIAAIPMPFQLPCPMVISTPSQYIKSIAVEKLKQNRESLLAKLRPRDR